MLNQKLFIMHFPNINSKIAEFKELWQEEKNYISLELTNKEIEEFIDNNNSMEMAVDQASDYLLANGNAEVQE